MRNIILFSRFEDEYKLVQIEGNMYKPDFGNFNSWVRIGGTLDDIQYIDPPGGPILFIGHKFPTGESIKSIKMIDNEIFIEIE
jgi:hypothetical protein